jgi:hypothetical protein
LTSGDANTLRWNGRPGHYEVYYVTLTDAATGVGYWIRYTLLAPEEGAPSCALWFLAMDPANGITARRETFPIAQLTAHSDPFRLEIGSATLADGAAAGELEDVAWSLRWDPGRTYEHVRPALRPAASTIYCLPHGDVAFAGQIHHAGRTVHLDGARGAQAHLWGSKHARRWAWARCSDFRTTGGEHAEDTFVDGVSARVSRFGRELGPFTPVVGRIDGEDFASTTTWRVLKNHSSFSPDRWRFEALGARRKLVGEVEADRRLLAGVTYHDPDGQPAYCYNTETATMRLEVYERTGARSGWRHAAALEGEGCAHFEYAQREPLPGLELHLR